MVNSARQFDLVVFGSNAFTGKLATDYIAKNFPPKIRWAISGRNSEKLESLYKDLLSSPNPPEGYFVFNHLDRQKVFELAAKTKVALTFAGPFGRYGENIVAACSQLGTHYVDITGETVWVQKMMEKYGASAVQSGAILIPFSGFDSVPSDLGVWQVLQQAKNENPDAPVTEVVSLFSAKGGINGGTFQTVLEMLENESEKDVFGESSALVPTQCKKEFYFPEYKKPVYVKEVRLTAPPFPMAPINSRVVYQSQALRMIHLGVKQPPFRYTELQKVSPRFSRTRAWTVILGGEILKRIGHFQLGRKALRAIGPTAGTGPSEKSRNSGYFKARFFAYSNDTLVSKCDMYFKGDPGNKATVTMACESARCLVVDGDKIATSIPGGFWTPSTALGLLLKTRLVEAGLRFS
ncbi:MAG: saccharopine dehydrogenase NADP-binding domain-containing protein [Bdellovibrionia bacterium]